MPKNLLLARYEPQIPRFARNDRTRIIGDASKPLILSRDSGYFYFGEILAMPLVLLVMLAPAQLEYAHLVVAPLGKDFRLHRRPGD